MGSHSTYRFLTACLVGLFLFLQVSAAVHAMEAGETHEDNCVYCVAVSEEENAFEAVLDDDHPKTENSVEQVVQFTTQFADIWGPRPLSRAPPPRGPPNSF